MLKVLQIAQAEVGTRESGDNGTLYARDLDAIHYFNTPKQNLAWCAVFVCWCFVQAYGADAARRVLFQPEQDNCAAACSYAANYYRQRGRFGLSPKIGAQIFFGQNAGDHTGLVYSYDAARVYTIEGNSDDRVARRSYDLSNPWIAGYGYPDYESLPNGGEESGDEPEPPDEDAPAEPDKNRFELRLRILRIGDSGEDVRALQTLLAMRGFRCGFYGADGEFGAATEKAVRKFQTAYYLAVDGEAGHDTWSALLGL
jgi:hypothetical protein